jgi:Mrp family chromosome partitioning ATPase
VSVHDEADAVPNTHVNAQPDTTTNNNHHISDENENGGSIDPSTSTPTSSRTTKRGSLRCMSLGFLLRDRGDAVIWRGPKKTAMIRQFLTDVYWGETDYLLIDTPPGTSDEHIALAEQLLTIATTTTTAMTTVTGNEELGSKPRLAGAVLVTTPQAVATADVRKEINFCAKTNIPVLGVIENMSGYACPCCGEISNVFSSGGGQVMATEMGVPFLGSVPVDVKFGAMVESKKIDGDDDYDDEDDIDRDTEMENGGIDNIDNKTREEEDDRLLVDRYRDTWSLPIFERFAKSLLQTIEGAAST